MKNQQMVVRMNLKMTSETSKRLQRLSKKTGLNMSQLVRTLIDAAYDNAAGKENKLQGLL